MFDELAYFLKLFDFDRWRFLILPLNLKENDRRMAVEIGEKFLIANDHDNELLENFAEVIKMSKKPISDIWKIQRRRKYFGRFG